VLDGAPAKRQVTQRNHLPLVATMATMFDFDGQGVEVAVVVWVADKVAASLVASTLR
jgi:hypothetical protein